MRVVKAVESTRNVSFYYGCRLPRASGYSLQNRPRIFTPSSSTPVCMKQKQDQFLQRTRLALTNALTTPELLTALAQYTYDAEKIREGLALYDRVEDLTRQRERAQEAQYQATQLLNAAKDELLYIFRIHTDTARLAYRREAKYQDTLGVASAPPRETAACLAHIKRFYAHVPAPMMTKYHVPQKELTQATQLAARVEELLALQKKSMSQSQQISDVRQRTLKELQTWMRRFDKITLIAFDEQPQQREALGKTVR